jgi:hypothetical protein
MWLGKFPTIQRRSIFWEVRASVILSKNMHMYMCSIPNGFRDKAISLYNSKLMMRKRYYILFLIPVFIVQETNLVQFTKYNTF